MDYSHYHKLYCVCSQKYDSDHEVIITTIIACPKTKHVIKSNQMFVEVVQCNFDVVDNLEIPINLMYLSHEGSEVNIINMLVNNGYYDDIEKISPPFDYQLITIRYATCDMSWQYKRRCLNLNWLFYDNFLWDFNINIIIDNFIGKSIET